MLGWVNLIMITTAELMNQPRYPYIVQNRPERRVANALVWSSYFRHLRTPKVSVKLARLISLLRRVRPRVPFYKLAAHCMPTLWSLYRVLLREPPAKDVCSQIVLFDYI